MNQAVETEKTFCHFCHAFCGLEVDVADGRVLEVCGDTDNLISEGYTSKGRSEEADRQALFAAAQASRDRSRCNKDRYCVEINLLAQ